MTYENHWLPGFNFNVEEWDAKGQTYETLAICRTLAAAYAAFAAGLRRETRRALLLPRRSPALCYRPRCNGSARLAQEAQSAVGLLGAT